MKKVPKSTTKSLLQILEQVRADLYTKQTVESLFRALVETIIENRDKALVLMKLNNETAFQGLLSRLKFSEAHSFSYGYEAGSNFDLILSNDEIAEDDEFLIIFADRFSAALVWNSETMDNNEIVQGVCTLNPNDTGKLVQHLQSIAYDESLNECLNEIRQDRRHNTTFTSILNKLLASLENKQRDLICAGDNQNSEEKEVLYSEDFLSVVTHEMSTPLSIIELYTTIINKNLANLQKANVPELNSIQNAALSIHNASIMLNGILSELRRFSGKLELNKAVVDLISVLKEVISLITPAFAEKEVNFVFENKINTNVEVNVDKIKISQVVINLLKNALQATDKNGIVKLILAGSDENSISISVEDTGSGIDKANISKVFVPYFTTKKEGKGIGLAFSKKIMEAHNGSLTLQKTGPEGTTFLITLPVDKN